MHSGVLETMPNDSAKEPTAFQRWLQEQFKARGFYLESSDRYAIRDFVRMMALSGETLDEVSLRRYLRDGITPSPDRIRSIARSLGIKPAEPLKLAGYIQESDF